VRESEQGLQNEETRKLYCSPDINNLGHTGVDMKIILKWILIGAPIPEARRRIGWWKMGIWRLKGVRGNTEQGMCPMCNKEEGWSHILRCEETRS
jgi:hypothetical protein